MGLRFPRVCCIWLAVNSKDKKERARVPSRDHNSALTGSARGRRMKNVAMLLWMLSVSCLFLPDAAMADNYVEKAAGKLANGAANAAGAILEIPKTVKIASLEKGPVYGMTAGVVAGILHTIGRTVYGVVDMATFMIPTSPLVDPEYVWNDFGTMTTYRAAVQMR